MSRLKRIFRRYLPDRRPFILAYHRVADLAVDPWKMAVTPENFDRQMKAIAGRTGGRINRSILRSSPRQAYVVFDDGYADNYENALPILQKHRIEATVFLATGFVGSPREYWWDRLEKIFLLPGRLPNVLDIRVHDDAYRLPLRGDANYSTADFDRHRAWRPSSPPPTMRHLAYIAFWAILRRADRTYQEATIASLENWAECGSEPRKHFTPVTIAQVREMDRQGIHFGAHTVNHVAASHCTADRLAREISESKRQVADLTGRDTSVFSYPYGDATPAAQGILSGQKFALACTSRKNRISRDTPPLLVPRIFVGNDSLPLIQSLLS